MLTSWLQLSRQRRVARQWLLEEVILALSLVQP
jgi:hypothetical protein